MRDIELFLTALAARVYEARLGGAALNDATDFRAWLVQCSHQAARATSMEDFFRAIDGDQAPRVIDGNGDSKTA